MTSQKRISLIATMAAFGALALSSQAQAVPCGPYDTHGGIKVGSTDLGASSATCREISGSNNDFASDLNTGNFFGSNTWVKVNKVPDEALDTSLWSFDPILVDDDDVKIKSGQFTISDLAWSLYSQLVVVLKDGGSTLDKNIKWSAYLLPTGVTGPYEWSYDGGKAISHITLYGIVGGGTVSVPEPATLGIFAMGLFGAGMVLRRKQAQTER
jgi:hypothetical protein